MVKVWDDEAWEDYVNWQTADKKTLKRINALIKDIDRNGYAGIIFYIRNGGWCDMATISFEKNFYVTAKNVDKYAAAFSEKMKPKKVLASNSTEVKSKDLDSFLKLVKI